MSRRLAVVVLLGTLAALAVAAGSRPQQAGAADNDEVLERGQYLVRQVALCGDCHGSSLMGAKLDFLAQDLPAAHTAPRIAGLPQLNRAQALAFLETGRLPSGKPARPPMPQYRFHRDDAVAIVAYLKSLH